MFTLSTRKEQRMSTLEEVAKQPREERLDQLQRIAWHDANHLHQLERARGGRAGPEELEGVEPVDVTMRSSRLSPIAVAVGSSTASFAVMAKPWGSSVRASR